MTVHQLRVSSLLSAMCAATAFAPSSQVFAQALPEHTGGRILVVNQTAAKVTEEADGTTTRPFHTISAAAERAMPGDMVYVLPGIYRERVAPPRGGLNGKPIIYQAAPGHTVFVRGSQEWKPQWQSVAGQSGVYTAALDTRLFSATNPYRIAVGVSGKPLGLPARPASSLAPSTLSWQEAKTAGRLPRTLGQVFVDGKPLREAESLQEVYNSPQTWMVNTEGTGLIVHFADSAVPLENQLVELTTRDAIFAPIRRGLEYITVRGFVFEHAANQGPFPQNGAVSTRSGGHWLIEDNIIRYAKTIGLDAGGQTWDAPSLPEETVTADRKLIIKGNNVIQNNVIAYNGLTGLAAWNCPRIRVIGNRVEQNNFLGFRPGGLDHAIRWEEHAGIKLHVASNGLVQNNLVQNNDAPGIWIDGGFTNARITGNVLLNNASAGIMMELGNGPALIDHNVVAFSRAFSSYYQGDGIYGHDASGLTVAHNLCYANARYGVFFQRITERKIGKNLVEASNLRVLNNLLVDNARSALSLPAVNERAKQNLSDFNVIGKQNERPFLNAGETKAPDGLNMDEWRRRTGWDNNSVIADPERLIIRSQTQEIEIQLGPGAGLLTVPAIDPGFEYAGPPLPKDKVLAGPWQNLDSKNHRFFLWPGLSAS